MARLAILLRRFDQGITKEPIVGLGAKNGLTVIAALNDVLRLTGNDVAGKAGHDACNRAGVKSIC